MAKFRELDFKSDEIKAQNAALMQSVSSHDLVYWTVDFTHTGAMSPEELGDYIAGTRVEADMHDANVVSSAIVDPDVPEFQRRHIVAVDVDHKVVSLSSGTEGHHHLYIDVPMTWEKYEALLVAMVDCGIVEPGYLEASRIRRATFLRVPWVPKDAKQVEPPPVVEDEFSIVGCSNMLCTDESHGHPF
jgi:hypothetical protein